MSNRVAFTLTNTQTPSANPQTLVQLLAASNIRITILGLDIGFGGATPAEAPIRLDWVLQTNAITSPTVLTAQKNDRGYEESIAGTFNAHNANMTAPTGTTVIQTFSLHPQGHAFWRPPTPLIVHGGGTPERLGLRHHGTNYYSVTWTLYCEQ